MARSEYRPDLRKTIGNIRKGKPHKLPAVFHRGQEFDGIIYRWVRDLEVALDSIDRALAIKERISDDEWLTDNDSYVALCKWIETSLDRIQQFDAESSKTLSQVIALPWTDLRITRNDMVHAFQQNTPTDAKVLVNERLPQLKQLIELLSIVPKTVQNGHPTKIPVYSLDHLKENLTPVTVEPGAQVGCIGTAYIYVHYDPYYRPHIALSGYQEDGTQWTAMLYNEKETVNSTYVPRNRGYPIL